MKPKVTGARVTSSQRCVLQRYAPDPNDPGFYAPQFAIGQPNSTAYPHVDEKDLPKWIHPIGTGE